MPLLVKSWFTYKVKAQLPVGNTFIEYHGMSAILPRQSVWQAAAVRRKWLEERPPNVLRNAHILRMSVVSTGLRSEGAALLQEAVQTAESYFDHGTEQLLVRGGPWCRKYLNAADRSTLRLVLNADGDARKIWQVGRDYADEHVLLKHLQKELYSHEAGHLENAALFPANRPPVAVHQRKNKSGASGWKKWRKKEAL